MKHRMYLVFPDIFKVVHEGWTLKFFKSTYLAHIAYIKFYREQELKSLHQIELTLMGLKIGQQAIFQTTDEEY